MNPDSQCQLTAETAGNDKGQNYTRSQLTLMLTLLYYFDSHNEKFHTPQKKRKKKGKKQKEKETKMDVTRLRGMFLGNIKNIFRIR